MPKRSDIIREAREWIGTPFIHQGRTKGVGCDCVGVLKVTAETLGITLEDIINYGRFPDSEMLKKHLNKVLIPISIDKAIPGDILLFKIMGNPQHLGLLTDKGILHTDSTIGRVVEHIFDTKWKKRLVRAYKFPGVED